MLSIVVIFASRLLLVLLFLPFSALDKVLNFKQSLAQASRAVLAPWPATLLVLAGFSIEVVMSLAILSGVADRLAAFILAGYCLITAILWKQFWRTPDFRLRGESGGRELFWDFMKNAALAGGFLMLAFGTGASGVRRFVDHPLRSSHPYSVIDESVLQ
ncbi:MAG TPA: DoxX family protein [Rhizomicrobium sp.]